MKKTHLLLALVSLSLTVASASAANPESRNDCVELPAYTVSAPRQSAAEKQISRNLEELRDAAKSVMPVKAVVPLADEAARDAAKVAPRIVLANS